MKDFNKYFIVGTNSDALQDTMNGMVVGELIRCKDCKYWNGAGKFCDYEMSGLEEDYCSWAEPKDTTEEVRKQLKDMEQRREMDRKK